MWSVHMYHLCLDTYEVNKAEVKSILLLTRRDIQSELCLMKTDHNGL